jgi:hypothetical protein
MHYIQIFWCSEANVKDQNQNALGGTGTPSLEESQKEMEEEKLLRKLKTKHEANFNRSRQCIKFLFITRSPKEEWELFLNGAHHTS